MTLFVADYALWQHGLALEDLWAADFRAINWKISHGLTLKSVASNLATRVDSSRAMGFGVSTFHWLDNTASGAEQARFAWSRIQEIGGSADVAHQVDCESTATEGVWQDYVWAMQDLIQRPIATYSADWWWKPRGWQGVHLTPYLWSAPMRGYVGAYPGDDSPDWLADYGGWKNLAVMQYAAAPLFGGTIDVSKSAIRDLSVWAGLTGGDGIVTQPDPGNAPPEAWSIPMRPTHIAHVRAKLFEEVATAAGEPADPIKGEVSELSIGETRLPDELSRLPLAPLEPRGAALCAPPIRAALAEWTALGGGNSGCVANLSTHFSGFHLSVAQLKSKGTNDTDYSCKRDPNGWDGPFASEDYACAGDFRHGGVPALRDKHRRLLARLMAGDPSLSMICEMITQPWANLPVYYWARWNGVDTLQLYTGAGHDMWSHVGWYRSMANRSAKLWEDDVALTAAQAANIEKIDTVLKNVGTVLTAVRETAGALNTAAVREAARDAAQNVLIEQQRTLLADLIALVRAGGGDIDTAAILAKFDQLPAAMREAAEVAAESAAGEVLARIQAAQEAEAAAYRPKE